MEYAKHLYIHKVPNYVFDSLQLHNGETRESAEMRAGWEMWRIVREDDETQKAAKDRKKR